MSLWCRVRRTKIQLEMDTVSVKVRWSNVRGVFAFRDIKAIEYVCIYDGEPLANDVIKNSSVDADVSYWVTHPKNPKMVFWYAKNNVGVGQLISDAKIIQLRELDYKHGIETCQEYVKKSKELANADFTCETNQGYQERRRIIHSLWLSILD